MRDSPPKWNYDQAWKAVLEREPVRDGSLLYAVRTTGIYCRPSCPAKRPKRENVTFFRSAREAESAGFRACKRCAPGSDEAVPAGDAAVARARRFLDDQSGRIVPLAALARHVGVSPQHLHRTFTRTVGLSPKAYQDALRVERLKHRLRQGDTVSRAAFEAGFGSVRAAYDRAEAGMGMSPGTYRKGGRGVTLRHAGADTAFGRLLVAATDRGVCAISLGDTEAELVASLARELPHAGLVEDHEGLEPWVRALRDHLEGAGPLVGLPSDLAGTEFQMRVWRALQEIPFGETRSYRELAASLDRPNAARAVARACASNRVALVVPCHRVVRANGEVGGYRWGIDRKRSLLEQESRLVRSRSPLPGQRRPPRSMRHHPDGDVHADRIGVGGEEELAARGLAPLESETYGPEPRSATASRASSCP